MDAVGVALLAAGLFVGLTGTWSPCGFSMIDTIGPRGHDGGHRVTVAACATFAVGAPIGGAITFGALALLGKLAIGAAGELAYLVAAAIALAAAIAEARGAPIRADPPAAAGVLAPPPADAARLVRLRRVAGPRFHDLRPQLGVFALAAIAFALGEPALGLAIGVAFGVGRAVPICAIAPIADSPAGVRAVEAMADRPGLLRGARLGDAAALVVVGIALVAGGQASVAETAEPAVPVDARRRSRTAPPTRSRRQRLRLPGRAVPRRCDAGFRQPLRPARHRPRARRALGRDDRGWGDRAAQPRRPERGESLSGGERRRGRGLGQVDGLAIALEGARPPGCPPDLCRREGPQGAVARRLRQGRPLGRPALDGDRLAYARPAAAATPSSCDGSGGGGKRLVSSDREGLRTPRSARATSSTSAPPARATL